MAGVLQPQPAHPLGDALCTACPLSAIYSLVGACLFVLGLFAPPALLPPTSTAQHPPHNPDILQ